MFPKLRLRGPRPALGERVGRGQEGMVLCPERHPDLRPLRLRLAGGGRRAARRRRLDRRQDGVVLQAQAGRLCQVADRHDADHDDDSLRLPGGLRQLGTGVDHRAQNLVLSGPRPGVRRLQLHAQLVERLGHVVHGKVGVVLRAPHRGLSGDKSQASVAKRIRRHGRRRPRLHARLGVRGDAVEPAQEGHVLRSRGPGLP
mmetsp:Transcript_23737/g.68651  ORF Transcript_23737/g.68651 Transcript_23737/m.68651 type:complete len:200 (+) Transcript_23737:207-806(+)